jgi:hypothetical protein
MVLGLTRPDAGSVTLFGRIVADGPATEIKAKVSGRTIRATIPIADPAELAGLPGVTSADRHGEAAILTCADSDLALRGAAAAAQEVCLLGGGPGRDGLVAPVRMAVVPDLAAVMTAGYEVHA